MLPDQGALEETKASMKVSQPDTTLSSDPAKHCTMCQSPFGKKNEGLVPAQQAQPAWHQNACSSPRGR